MPTISSQCPDDFEFAPRHPAFEIESVLADDWHGGNAFRTAWFNALSSQFPLGEKYFIDSVRFFSAEVEDARLAQQIRAFQGQEAIHRLEHQKYNEHLCRLRGYDLDVIESKIRDRLQWARSELSPKRQLAGTVAYEHLTAVMADDLLRHDDVLRGADPVIADLWRWHAVEETEHKSVAFDLYVAVGGRLRERRIALLMNTGFFLKDTLRICYYMLRADGRHKDPRVWLSGLSFLLGKPGVLRRILLKYLGFYRKTFHPWKHDNRELIAAWKTHQAASHQPSS